MTDWMFTGNLNLNEIFVFINVAHKRGLGRGINMVIPTTDIHRGSVFCKLTRRSGRCLGWILVNIFGALWQESHV